MSGVVALSNSGKEWLSKRRKTIVVDNVERLESFAAAFDRVKAYVDEMEVKIA
jgi:hypothetical protein